MRYSTEVSRLADKKVGDELGRMIAWLKRTGLKGRHLSVAEMRSSHIIYRAEFDTETEAQKFFDAFDETNVALPGKATAPGFV